MEIWIWLAFVGFVLLMLALDLGVFHRRDRVISIGEALAWTGFWIVLAIGFNVVVYYLYAERWLGFGRGLLHELSASQAALQFSTGFLIEKSLSVDNIFVIAMIFAYFRVPLALQHRVLFWGIFGALALRGLMIAAGAALIARFQWTVYVFGGLLLVTAVKLLVARHDNLEPDKVPLVRFARRFLPVTEGFRGNRFLVRDAAGWAMTPLAVALLVVGSSDVLFAIDSIPAIFAVTRDPFLVFTSNVFAVLGLRSLYFALAGMLHRFRYLKMSLVFVLAFVGVKMNLTYLYPIPIVASLAFICGLLGVGVAASIAAPDRDTAPLASPFMEELDNLRKIGMRGARRVVILVVGSSVLLIGVVMIVLPGPATLVIPAGLAILAYEFVWARRWLLRFRKTARRLGRSVERRTGIRFPRLRLRSRNRHPRDV